MSMISFFFIRLEFSRMFSFLTTFLSLSDSNTEQKYLKIYTTNSIISLVFCSSCLLLIFLFAFREEKESLNRHMLSKDKHESDTTTQDNKKPLLNSPILVERDPNNL